RNAGPRVQSRRGGGSAGAFALGRRSVSEGEARQAAARAMSDDLVATLRAIVERFDALSIAYMIVGSVAALAHGRPRSTQDFDVVIEVDRASLLALVRSLPPERFYVSEDAAIEAL